MFVCLFHSTPIGSEEGPDEVGAAEVGGKRALGEISPSFDKL
jgi:hypothetical protein